MVSTLASFLHLEHTTLSPIFIDRTPFPAADDGYPRFGGILTNVVGGLLLEADCVPVSVVGNDGAGSTLGDSVRMRFAEALAGMAGE